MVRKFYEADFLNGTYKTFDHNRNVVKHARLHETNYGQGIVESVEFETDGFYTAEFNNKEHIESYDVGEYSRLVIRFCSATENLSIIMYGKDILTHHYNFKNGSTFTLFKDGEVVLVLHRIFVSNQVYYFTVDRILNYGSCGDPFCEDC